jgi:type IV pilus assembly protein PilA
MLSKLRRRVEDEKGFTLIELLVVILIIGILAAIAIPAFLNQRQKAYDAAAKSNLRTAQTAEETYSTDNGGAYTTTLSDLTNIEPALNNPPTVSISAPSGDNYQLQATAAGSDPVTYTLAVATNGAVTRTCNKPGHGGCNASGGW